MPFDLGLKPDLEPDLRSARVPAVAQPLLTIAIPTFNRAAQLDSLLRALEPQVAGVPDVEILVSDNASPDATQEVLAVAAERFRRAGSVLHAHRQSFNIGSDANFAFCFAQAAGHFFWMCGDDDLLVPEAVAEVLAILRAPDGGAADLDMIYATSYGFRDDPRAERVGDPLGRQVHTVADPRTFATVVNIMFTFISGMIVNKGRLGELRHEAPERLIGTNLVQLSWCLPLLLHHRRSAVLWTRPVAARVGQAHGYSLGRVFGRQLRDAVARLLPGRPDLAAPILNMALRRWFPSVLVDSRAASGDGLRLDEAHGELRAVYGRNPRYWIFTYPALRLPLPLARRFLTAIAVVNKLIYALQVPGFWRKRS